MVWYHLTGIYCNCPSPRSHTAVLQSIVWDKCRLDTGEPDITNELADGYHAHATEQWPTSQSIITLPDIIANPTFPLAV